VTVQLLHVSDLHFGGLARIAQIEALEGMIPDLRPDAVVITAMCPSGRATASSSGRGPWCSSRRARRRCT